MMVVKRFLFHLSLVSLVFLQTLGSAPAQVQSVKSPDFRIFWWNIEKGLTNRYLGDNTLNKSLLSILAGGRHAAAPDVVALGEFTHEAVDKEVMRALREQYPFEAFFPYNIHTPDLGIVVFAKGKVDVFPLQELGWAQEESEKQEWIQSFPGAYFFTRHYIRLRITHSNGRSFNFIPLHTAQPWDRLTERFGRLIGGASVGLALAFGDNNPLMYQLRELQRVMQDDFGDAIADEPVVLVGDLNVPKSVALKKTPAYKILASKLKDAFPRAQATFPARRAKLSGRYPNLQIDHAFTSSHVSVVSSQVLTLEGSDHYPLFLGLSLDNCRDLLRR